MIPGYIIKIVHELFLLFSHKTRKMNTRSAHDSDAPRWFDNWTNMSFDPHFTWVGIAIARLEAWLGGKFDRQQESQDSLGTKLDKLLERMESLEAKVDKLQGSTQQVTELVCEKHAMSTPETFNDFFAEACCSKSRSSSHRR